MNLEGGYASLCHPTSKPLFMRLFDSKTNIAFVVK